MASIPVLRAALGVRFTRIEPGGFRILAALQGAVDFLGIDLLITAGTDHHDAGKHIAGEAYDLRVKDLTDRQIVDCYNYLKNALGPAFTVLYEVRELPNHSPLRTIAYVNPSASGPHVHVQVKRGTAYPPAEPGLVA